MNNEKVNEVLRGIVDRLRKEGATPLRLTGAQLSLIHIPIRSLALGHCHALALAALEMPAEKLEKKFRWLGWIQGVLWTFGVQSIEEAKRANMPEAEK